jgi:putative membrane protein insertion efficiency factor
MKTIMLAAVRFYRIWISPALPGSCRFAPTCSAYAHQALERHGAWRGALMTARRLLSCHPFHPGGYDPVPEKTVSEYRGTGVSGTEPEPVKHS